MGGLVLSTCGHGWVRARRGVGGRVPRRAGVRGWARARAGLAPRAPATQVRAPQLHSVQPRQPCNRSLPAAAPPRLQRGPAGVGGGALPPTHPRLPLLLFIERPPAARAGWCWRWCTWRPTPCRRRRPAAPSGCLQGWAGRRRRAGADGVRQFCAAAGPSAAPWRTAAGGVLSQSRRLPGLSGRVAAHGPGSKHVRALRALLPALPACTSSSFPSLAPPTNPGPERVAAGRWAESVTPAARPARGTCVPCTTGLLHLACSASARRSTPHIPHLPAGARPATLNVAVRAAAGGAIAPAVGSALCAQTGQPVNSPDSRCSATL